MIQQNEKEKEYNDANERIAKKQKNIHTKTHFFFKGPMHHVCIGPLCVSKNVETG